MNLEVGLTLSVSISARVIRLFARWQSDFGKSSFCRSNLVLLRLRCLFSDVFPRVKLPVFALVCLPGAIPVLVPALAADETRLPALAASVWGDSPRVRLEALRSLAKIPPARAATRNTAESGASRPRGGALGKKQDLAKLDTVALLDRTLSKSGWEQEQSRVVLRQRGADQVLPAVKPWLAKQTDPRAKLEAMWLHEAFEKPTDDLVGELVAAKDERLRTAAARQLAR